MSGKQVLFVRRLTKAVLPAFKKLAGVAAQLRNTNISDEQLLALPDVAAVGEFDVLFRLGLAIVVPDDEADEEAHVWVNNLKKLLPDEPLNVAGMHTVLPSEALINRFRSMDANDVLTRAYEELTAFKSLQASRGGKRPAQSAASSSRGGGPRVKRAATASSSSSSSVRRKNNKLFISRR